MITFVCYKIFFYILNFHIEVVLFQKGILFLLLQLPVFLNQIHQNFIKFLFSGVGNLKFTIFLKSCKIFEWGQIISSAHPLAVFQIVFVALDKKYKFSIFIKFKYFLIYYRQLATFNKHKYFSVSPT